MELYEQIERAIRQHAEYLNVGNSVTEVEVLHAIRWVMRDNSDIFWFVHQYHFDKDNGIVSFRYRCSPERCAIIQESIDDVVVNDFKIAHVRTLSQLEQVTYVYKWMLTYCNYNTNSAYNQNIDSVFVRRNSVCTGYAKAAQYLFKLLGIESRLVFGRLNNGIHKPSIQVVETKIGRMPLSSRTFSRLFVFFSAIMITTIVFIPCNTIVVPQWFDVIVLTPCNLHSSYYTFPYQFKNIP